MTGVRARTHRLAQRSSRQLPDNRLALPTPGAPRTQALLWLALDSQATLQTHLLPSPTPTADEGANEENRAKRQTLPV